MAPPELNGTYSCKLDTLADYSIPNLKPVEPYPYPLYMRHEPFLDIDELCNKTSLDKAASFFILPEDNEACAAHEDMLPASKFLASATDCVRSDNSDSSMLLPLPSSTVSEAVAEDHHGASATCDTSGTLQKVLYCLAKVDESTGAAMRPVTDEEAEQLSTMLASVEVAVNYEGCAPLRGNSAAARMATASTQLVPMDKIETQQALLRKQSSAAASLVDSQGQPAAGFVQEEQSSESAGGNVTSNHHGRTFHHKTGGPCDHCGATESPQWRRGPAAKPMLCNACGTRFRRTNQLGAPGNTSAGRAEKAERQAQLDKRQGEACSSPVGAKTVVKVAVARKHGGKRGAAAPVALISAKRVRRATLSADNYEL